MGKLPTLKTKGMIMKWLYNLFNRDKIDMQGKISMYKVRIKQLEDGLMEYKGYKLKYDVIKLYVDDDDALIELFDIAEKADKYKDALRQHASGQGSLGVLGTHYCLDGSIGAAQQAVSNVF